MFIQTMQISLNFWLGSFGQVIDVQIVDLNALVEFKQNILVFLSFTRVYLWFILVYHIIGFSHMFSGDLFFNLLEIIVEVLIVTAAYNNTTWLRILLYLWVGFRHLSQSVNLLYDLMPWSSLKTELLLDITEPYLDASL